VKFGADVEFQENWSWFYFSRNRNERNEQTNEPANQPTNKGTIEANQETRPITIPPGGSRPNNEKNETKTNL